MQSTGLEYRIHRFHEYNIKPAVKLARSGEFGYLIGSIFEKAVGQNPYFWYRQKTGKDRFILCSVRDHEMWIDIYDRGLSRHLFIRGVHEAMATKAYRDALSELQATVDKEVTVLDVGANIGYYVLEELQVLGRTASVVAFEPDPQNRALLKRNVTHNGYTDQVKFSSKAVDAISGERTFYRSTHSNWSRLEGDSRTGNGDQLVESYSVETTSLDEFIVEHEIDPATVGALRMDLEGHEVKVLEGMETILETDQALVLFIEFHPDFVDVDTYEATISMLESYGFEINFAGQSLETLDIESFDELRSVRGSHVRVLFSR